jgi:hypothetical protein
VLGSSRSILSTLPRRTCCSMYSGCWRCQAITIFICSSPPTYCTRCTSSDNIIDVPFPPSGPTLHIRAFLAAHLLDQRLGKAQSTCRGTDHKHQVIDTVAQSVIFFFLPTFTQDYKYMIPSETTTLFRVCCGGCGCCELFCPYLSNE